MRFDSICLQHVTGITVEKARPIEDHNTFTREIRIHFENGSYTTIDCHSDSDIKVDYQDLDTLQKGGGMMKRFEPIIEYSADHQCDEAVMIPDDEGEFVEYDDAMKEIESLRLYIDGLEKTIRQNLEALRNAPFIKPEAN